MQTFGTLPSGPSGSLWILCCFERWLRRAFDCFWGALPVVTTPILAVKGRDSDRTREFTSNVTADLSFLCGRVSIFFAGGMETGGGDAHSISETTWSFWTGGLGGRGLAGRMTERAMRWMYMCRWLKLWVFMSESWPKTVWAYWKKQQASMMMLWERKKKQNMRHWTTLQRVTPRWVFFQWKVGSLIVHTVDREIFMLKIIRVKFFFMLTSFRGSLDPQNFFNGWRLHNGQAPSLEHS